MPILAPSDRPEWPPLDPPLVLPVLEPASEIPVADPAAAVVVRRPRPGMDMPEITAPVAAGALTAAGEVRISLHARGNGEVVLPHTLAIPSSLVTRSASLQSAAIQKPSVTARF